MTPQDLKRIRKRVAPHLSQAAFAAALGYTDRDAYRRYENGRRWPPHPILLRLMALLDERGELPDWFDDVVAEPPADAGADERQADRPTRTMS